MLPPWPTETVRVPLTTPLDPTSDVTVVVPHIASRADMLTRAWGSVRAQTRLPAMIHVEVDRDRAGPGVTRNRALAKVTTEYVAFLDDDDEFLPAHLELLRNCAALTGADVVYPWFNVIGGADPLGRFGLPFDAAHLRGANYVPVTVLARIKAIRAVNGFEPPPTYGGAGPTCEDWGLWLKLADAGAKVVHLPERTWNWHHHGRNTGGRTDLW